MASSDQNVDNLDLAGSPFGASNEDAMSLLPYSLTTTTPPTLSLPRTFVAHIPTAPYDSHNTCG